MTYTTGPTSLWQKIRYLPERVPLRTKLIAAVLALVAVALVIISVAGLSFLRSYLLGTVDNQLYALEQRGGYGGYNPEGQVADGVVGNQVVPVSGHGFYIPPGLSGPVINTKASWLTSGNPVTVPDSSGPGRWRVLAVPNVPFATGNGTTVTGTLVYGIDVTPQYATLGKLTIVDLCVSGLLLIGVAAAGTAVVRASLRPLVDIEKTAGAIAAGDLTRRVPERDPRTEVGRLGRSLNAMLSQIETAFDAQSRSEAAARRSEERMRQFVADASHELRTPLTAIRGFAEYYRQRGGVRTGPEAEGGRPVLRAADLATAIGRNGTGKLPPADLDRIMRRVEQESARMGILVEDMLLLARLDQQRPLERKTVDLLTLAADAVHDARVVAPNRAINLSVAIGAALLVNGDEVRLRQVIGNLMSNALSHTPDGTPIDVRIRSGSMSEIEAATAAAGGPTGPAAPADSAAPTDPAGPEWQDEPGDLARPPAPHTYADPGQPGTAAAGHGATADAGGYQGRHAGAAQSAAVLEVTDYGPGLTEEQAAHAFERFYRVDAARTTGGTGLGLAIVAALVAAHGGAVWVRTRPGEGATFSIGLPLAPEAVREAGQDEDEQAAEDDAQSGPAWIEPASSGPARGSAA